MWSPTRDFAEAQISDTIHVEVAELEGAASATPSTVLTCLVESIELEGSSNFPNGIDFCGKRWTETS